jgi:hypothetical protein
MEDRDSLAGETRAAAPVNPRAADLADPDAPARDASRSPVGRTGLRRAEGRPRALTALAVIAVTLFALWGIGAPLVGTSTLTATNEMVSQGPWVNDGFAGIQPTNTWLDDTYTAGEPATILFKSQATHGHYAAWDPYSVGGQPLGAIPDAALLSPLTIPFYVLPTWLGPAYERLLEIIVAAGGCFLFLRRLSLSRPSAITGGLVYASSGFMVAWLGFPQTRVAAFIPVLFWTIERFIHYRRVRDAALVALPVAAMLLGGFPSVTGYAMLTAAGYVLVRLISLHRHEARKLVRPLAYLAGSVAAGIGLALFQLAPFLVFYKNWLIEGRGQTGAAHLPLSTLLTVIAPWAFGSVNPSLGTQFTLSPNLAESVSYLGAAAAVLVIASLALPRESRALLPKAVWLCVALSAAVWGALIYLGGPPLSLLQHAPLLRALFSDNYIGRARSILGFLLAVLAAIGLELALRARRTQAESPRPEPIWAVGVTAACVLLGAGIVWVGYRDTRKGAATSRQPIGPALVLYKEEVALAVVLVLVTSICVLLLRFASSHGGFSEVASGRLRLGAAAVVLILITVQSTLFVIRYYPHSPRNSFYPVTDTQRYLAAHLGNDRYASTAPGMVFGTNDAYQLRSVDGHGFINSQFAALVRGIPDNPIPSATYINFAPNDLAQATSPVLDLLGAKYWVAAPQESVFGTLHEANGTGTTTLTPGQPVTVPVPGTGRLRGIGLIPSGTVPQSLARTDKNSNLQVVIRDQTGKVISKVTRITSGVSSGALFEVAVAADTVSDNAQLIATITLHGTGSLQVQANGGVPALSTITDADDGLRLVYSGSTVIYQRLHAQPRIRWAAQSVVVPNQAQRVKLLSSGKVPEDAVVLTRPGPTAAGRPGTVTVDADGTDSITTKVHAQGAGYLVVADADQVGWKASVDGKPADLVPADQGLVAVPVPAGTHTVVVRYDLAAGRAGTVLSIVVAVFLVVICLGEWLWQRRRSRGSMLAEQDAPRVSVP